MNRQYLLRAVVFSIIGLSLLVSLAAAVEQQREPIKVGILHSLSGTMEISESAVVDAALLAIEEINAAGGINGQRLQPMVVDGRSDWDYFAREAERLIVDEQVAVIFGCWTSACRKTVRPVFERLNHLLIYPVQYEGLEQSPNILYTGAAPNQQIIPAVKWSLDNLGRRFFLVGSDYVFPRTANAIIRDQVTALQGEIVGEAYVLLGSQDMGTIIEDIVAAQPDVILNTINGDSNIAFFTALRAAGITPADIPTVSFSIAESELPTLNVDNLVGDYASWNYFQSIDGTANTGFVQRFQARYGADRVTSDPLESAYLSVYLWAQAVERSQTTNTQVIRETILDQSFNAPSGIVYSDPVTRHTWKTVRIGQIRADGQFDVVWDSGNPIRPDPYPIYRTQAEWEQFLNDLYTGWGNAWANPGD
jgi:urea transport system substrate-binding protein